MVKRIELALSPEQAATEPDYKSYISRKLSISKADISGYRVLKRSIDARSKNIKIRIATEVYLHEEPPEPLYFKPDYKNVKNEKPVHIIGSGPAGLFAALQFLELGIKPIIIERGKDVRNRRRDLAKINKEGIINPNSNYCFGEGGAGTYSDGKLYTRSHKRGSIQKILDLFVYHGADSNILIDAHPHIGTNKLPNIIAHIRDTILALGGEIHFNTVLTDVEVVNHQLVGISTATINDDGVHLNPTKTKCNILLLATGHSARDIYHILKNNRIAIESKDFALGVRIEHPQNMIDQIQYSCKSRNKYLPPASYSLTYTNNNNSVYSFCMCPGGIIAPASTAPDEIVVNGWSPSKRNNPYANSGLVVNVGADDFKAFESKAELSGMFFQSSVEQKAFKLGRGNLKAPAQTTVDFINNKLSGNLPKCSYVPGIQSAELKEVLTKRITDSLKEALRHFEKKMKGYISTESLMVGVESRTSSPVRIPRNKETLMHTSVEGLFPCAEGAGYAGGIVSAAMDGQKCAIKITEFIKAKN